MVGLAWSFPAPAGQPFQYEEPVVEIIMSPAVTMYESESGVMTFCIFKTKDDLTDVQCLSLPGRVFSQESDSCHLEFMTSTLTCGDDILDKSS